MELLFPLLLIAVFYFLLIRPQQRQRKQMAEMQRQLGPGSEVMTGAGLIGTVVAVNEEKDQVILEVAPGVTNTYVRRAIVNILTSPTTPGDDDLDGPSTDDSLAERPDDVVIDDRDDIDRALDQIETTDDDTKTSGSANGTKKSGDDSK